MSNPIEHTHTIDTTFDHETQKIVGNSTVMTEDAVTTNEAYTPTIGIEVHAELKTNTKMFCGCTNDPHAAEANTHICPVCMGHPGTLPVVNREAVSYVLKVGSALNAETAHFTEFDRKNYFYPDIPKGYQISQYEYPLVKGGELAQVKITRVHLEEDTARSLHDQGEGSLIDYNRAGVPLMELVTEPVIHDAKTAGNFARELQLLLRTLGVSDANMEKGEMRVEANISVSKTQTFGTKVEVKNLNSFKAVEGAIAYEIKRQTELLDRGEKVIQETRGWDENRSKTFAQRVKESADDYRYFPEPDIPKFDIAQSGLLSRVLEDMPELPEEKRLKYGNLGISREQVEVIISDIVITNFYDQVLINLPEGSVDCVKLAANYLVSDVMSYVAAGRPLQSATPIGFAELIGMVHEGKLTSRVAKDLLVRVVFEGVDVRAVAEQEGLLQNNATEMLLEIVRTVILENERVANEYRAGKVASLQYLIGQAMKATKGAANPSVLRELFVTELGS